MSLTTIVWIAIGLFGLLMFADDAAERGHRRSAANSTSAQDAIVGGCFWGLLQGSIGLLVFAVFFFVLWLMWVN